MGRGVWPGSPHTGVVFLLRERRRIHRPTTVRTAHTGAAPPPADQRRHTAASVHDALARAAGRASANVGRRQLPAHTFPAPDAHAPDAPTRTQASGAGVRARRIATHQRRAYREA